MGLIKYYKLSSPQSLIDFMSVYLPLVFNILEEFDVSVKKYNLQADHLGVQVLDAVEFDDASTQLSTYSKLIHYAVIHNRRNRVYQFNKALSVCGVEMPRIEIFEPKPGADLSKLKPGIEHIAFTTKKYDLIFEHFSKNNYPVDKYAEFKEGSKFFKTSFVNLVEVEFRNDFLGVG